MLHPSDLTTFNECQSVAFYCEVDLYRRAPAIVRIYGFLEIVAIFSLILTPIIHPSLPFFFLLSVFFLLLFTFFIYLYFYPRYTLSVAPFHIFPFLFIF